MTKYWKRFLLTGLLTTAVVTLGLWTSAATGVDDSTTATASADAKAETKADAKPKLTAVQKQMDAISIEFNEAFQDFRKQYNEAEDTEEREAALKLRPDPSDACAKILELVGEHPEDPGAVDGILWIIRVNGRSEFGLEAVTFAKKELLKHPKIHALLPVLVQIGTDDEQAAMFEEILTDNPNQISKGYACLALATYHDTPTTPEQAVAYLDRVTEEFSDVTIGNATLGEIAGQQLHDIKHLRVGSKVENIAGEDIFGEPMELDDYAGKIILLDFWGDW